MSYLHVELIIPCYVVDVAKYKGTIIIYLKHFI
jgi:hypothetical protein